MLRLRQFLIAVAVAAVVVESSSHSANCDEDHLHHDYVPDRDENSTCVPTECQYLYDRCQEYRSCSESLECMSTILEATGTCSNDCVWNCRSFYLDFAPFTLRREIADCYANYYQKRCGQEKQYSPICTRRCSNLYDQCAESESCLKGLACLNDHRRGNTTDKANCLSVPDRVEDREVLSQALFCQESCEHNEGCRSHSSSQDDCTASNRSDCHWNSYCYLRYDSCSKYISKSSCPSWCKWDKNQQCRNSDSPCNSYDDESSCRSNLMCRWYENCDSSNCLDHCEDKVSQCYQYDQCAQALGQLFNGESYDSCRRRVTCSSSLQAFIDAALCIVDGCESEGSGSGNGTTNSLFCLAERQCSDSFQQCRESDSCSDALDCASRRFKQSRYCGQECVDGCSAQYQVDNNTLPILHEAIECARNYCDSCEQQCSSAFDECRQNGDCNKGLTHMQASLTNQRCNSKCVTDSLAQIPEQSVGRRLFGRVLDCYVGCNEARDCGAATTQDKCTVTANNATSGLANCQWNHQCVPKVDSCRQHTDYESCSQDANCKFSNYGCISQWHDCYSRSDDGCEDSSSCRLLELCRPGTDCRDTCSDTVSACLQYNSCTNAWLCLQASRSKDTSQSDQCAAQHFGEGDEDAKAIFDSLADCYVNCSLQSRCNQQCDAASNRCSQHVGCLIALTCIANHDDCGPECAADCIADNTSPNGEDRAAAFNAIHCMSQCRDDSECRQRTTSSLCADNSKCEWSQRCTRVNSLSCERFLTETQCLAIHPDFCVWDTYTWSCLSSTYQCYADSELPADGPDTSEHSFIFNTAAACNSSCGHENQCRAKSSCDRQCESARSDCWNDSACLRALGCLHECEDKDSSCFTDCQSLLSSDESRDALVRVVTCQGSCRLDTCAECRDSRDRCLNNTNCEESYHCFAAMTAYGNCGKDCFDHCASASDDDESRELLFAAANCYYRCKDPYFAEHDTCSGISNYRSVSDAFRQYMCLHHDCFNATAYGLSANDSGCVWVDDDKECSCPRTNQHVADLVCQQDSDTCYDCCSGDLDYCKQNHTLGDCFVPYANCTKTCKSLSDDEESQENKDNHVNVYGSLSMDAVDNVGNLFNAKAIRRSVWAAIDSSKISELDVNILGFSTSPRARRDAEDVTEVGVNYFVRCPRSDAVQLSDNSRSAQFSFSVSTQIEVNTGAKTSFVNVSTDEVYFPPDANGNGHRPHPGVFIIITPLARLEPGSYLTEEQREAIAADFLTALRLPSGTEVAIFMIGPIVYAKRTFRGVLTDEDLQNDANQYVSIPYTRADGSTAVTGAVTEASKASQDNPQNHPDSDSNSGVIAGAVIGSVLGAAVLILLVVLFLRGAASRPHNQPLPLAQPHQPPYQPPPHVQQQNVPHPLESIA